MSLRRGTRNTTSRKTSKASIRHDPQTSKSPIPAPCPGKLDMDEVSLRKLTRTELQKLAKEHNVKANTKSSLIIEELIKLRKIVSLCQDEGDGEPVRKKSRTSLYDRTDHTSTHSEGKGSHLQPTQIMDPPMDENLDHATVSEDSLKSAAIPQNTSPTIATRNATVIAGGHSGGTPQGALPILESHQAPEDDNISDSGSDLSQASKNGLYNSPVSSRAGTPPLEEQKMIERAVKIMNQITADDQHILTQIAALRNRATMLKEQAHKVRDVVRAEHGRRVRLEAYFTYWREIEPEWPREWIYEEGEEERMRTEKALRAMPPPMPSAGPSGPSTLPVEERDVSTWAARMSLRRRQLQQRQDAYKKGTVAAAFPAGVDRPGERANLPSPQSSTGGRAEKRKSRA